MKLWWGWNAETQWSFSAACPQRVNPQQKTTTYLLSCRWAQRFLNLSQPCISKVMVHLCVYIYIAHFIHHLGKHARGAWQEDARERPTTTKTFLLHRYHSLRQYVNFKSHTTWIESGKNQSQVTTTQRPQISKIGQESQIKHISTQTAAEKRQFDQRELFTFQESTAFPSENLEHLKIHEFWVYSYRGRIPWRIKITRFFITYLHA